MTKIAKHKQQTQYLYDNPSWLYDYVFAFFYGFIQNDNYTYDTKSPNSINILPIMPYTYDSLQQRSTQAFGNMNYDYFSNMNKLILQNTYSSIFVASRGLSLRQAAQLVQR